MSDSYAPILGRPEPGYEDEEVMAACPRHGLVDPGLSFCKVCHWGRGVGEHLESVEVVTKARLTAAHNKIERAREFVEQQVHSGSLYRKPLLAILSEDDGGGRD